MSEGEDDRDRDSIGAPDGENADTLPAAPSGDDDTPLGDTDQHSDAPPVPAQP